MAETKSFDFFYGVAMGAILASTIAGVSRSCTEQETESRLLDIQQHSAQIYEELASGYTASELGQLILNDETDTYDFHLAPEGTEPMVCTGEYSVTDGVAEITGTIACTTTTEVAEVGGN